MSRRKRLEEEIEKINSSKTAIEELRDELQVWLDNMPENLQEGQKAEELEEAISSLNMIIDSLEEAEDNEVNFPGMY